MKEYWQNRIAKQGINAVSTIGDVQKRTVDEINFLTKNIRRIYPEKVKLAVDFGAGWGRLLPVLAATSERQILVDFVEQNEVLWEEFCSANSSCKFSVSRIRDFSNCELADYAFSSFSLLHIVDDNEYIESVVNMINSVRAGGYIFIYESYNNGGELSPHCSERNRSQFLFPFNNRVILDSEISWRSRYQPYDTNFHQPIKLFIFRGLI